MTSTYPINCMSREFFVFLHCRVYNFPQLIERYGLLEYYKIITAVTLLNSLFTHCCLSCGLVATARAAGSIPEYLLEELIKRVK